MIILGLCCGWCANCNTRGRHKTYDKVWMWSDVNNHLFHSPSMDFLLIPPFPPLSCVLNVIGSHFTDNNNMFKRLNNPNVVESIEFRIIRSSLLSVETDKRQRQWNQSCLRTKKVNHLLNSVHVSCVFPENRRFSPEQMWSHYLV